MSRERFLASIPLFSSLQADELQDILMLAQPFSFPAGHLVFDQGALADGMYVLETGRVQVWARLLGEEEVALAQIGAGGVLGEFSLLDRGPRSASAEVIEPTTGYFFSNRRFELLRADHRPAAQKTMQQLCSVLCARLRSAAGELSDSTPTFYEHTQRTSSPPPGEAPSQASAAQLVPSRLRVLPFFSEFSTAELQTLLAPLSALTLPRGHVLFSQGDDAAHSFVTVRGAVELIAGGRDAWRRVAILGPGKLFGLVEPLDGGKRHACAVVRENAIILEIPGPEFHALLRAESSCGWKFTDAVHNTLIESLRTANRTLLCHSAMGRVSRRKKRVPTIAPLT